jgi:hypothetical protein
VLFQPDCGAVATTAVNFDLSFLQRLSGIKVRNVVLRYDEAEWLAGDGWRDGAGNHLPAGDCVEVLGRATELREDRGRGGISQIVVYIPNEILAQAPGVREWCVGEEIRYQWIENFRPPLGFVLRGGNESVEGQRLRHHRARKELPPAATTWQRIQRNIDHWWRSAGGKLS